MCHLANKVHSPEGIIDVALGSLGRRCVRRRRSLGGRQPPPSQGESELGTPIRIYIYQLSLSPGTKTQAPDGEHFPLSPHSPIFVP